MNTDTIQPSDSIPPIIASVITWTTRILLGLAALFVIGVITWQAIAEGGAPDPTKTDTKPLAAVFDIGVLVFREGLECILVLAAITASMVGANRSHRNPVFMGAGIGFVATIITWFIAVAIINDLTDSVSALNLQAATGLLAVVVLLVVMNWFFHKIYWGGWITAHNRRKKELIADANSQEISHSRLVWGLLLLGFASFYREGFEVVLFLQSYHLKMGNMVVLSGALVGLLLSGIVAVLTFIAHHRLPHRRMLVFTGILLGAVLLVMVGEQAQEMQLAHWIPTTTIAALDGITPDWMGTWFAIFPTVETLVAQGLAALVVIGSYYLAQKRGITNVTAP